MSWEVSQADLSRIIGISTRQIHNLEREGLPHRAEGRRKLYPLPDAVNWYIRRREELARDAATSNDYELARTRRELARAKLAEMEVAEAEGRLIPREVVQEVYGGRMLDVLRSAVLNMPGRWGAQIVGLESPREGNAALRRIGAELLEVLSGDVADELEASGSAELPEDFPGRDALAAAGIRTFAELLDVEELESIPGVGRVTARKIREALSADAA